MTSPLLFLLSGAAFLGSAAQAAVAFRQARATPPPEAAFVSPDSISPVPTPGPDLKALLQRQSNAATTVYFAEDNTCGFLGGSKDEPYACGNEDAQCAIVTAGSLGFLGCCTEDECGRFLVDCVDYDQYWGESCDSNCETDTLTLKCSDADAPYCNTASIDGGEALQVYDYYCNTDDASTVRVLLTTYVGEDDGRSFSPSVLGGTASLRTVDETETIGNPAASSSLSSSSSLPPASPVAAESSPAPSSEPAPSHTPAQKPAKKKKQKKKSRAGSTAGAIAGSVVAALILLGSLVAVLVKSRKRDEARRRQQEQQQQEEEQQDQPPVAPSAPPPSLQAIQEHTPLAAVSPEAPEKSDYAGQPPPAPPPQYHSQPPDGADPVSPLTPGCSRMSSVSEMTSGTWAPVSPISPQTTGQTMATMAAMTTMAPVDTAVPTGGAGPGTGVPATIHEAGGEVVGGPSDNHRGVAVRER